MSDRAEPLGADIHEPIALQNSLLTHEMRFAEITSLFHQHPTDDLFKESSKPDGKISMLMDGSMVQISNASVPDASLHPPNGRLSFRGRNFFTTPGKSLEFFEVYEHLMH